MYVPYRDNCFELLGFDILLDSSLNPWLLEVNLSPSLNCDAPLDQKIKGELIADLFTMIGIVPLDQRALTDSFQLSNPSQFNPYIMATQDAKSGRRGSRHANTAAKLQSSNVQVASTKARSQEEKAVIRLTDDEYKRYLWIRRAACRRGRFVRIFPTDNYAFYKQFFEAERPLNTLLAQRLGTSEKS